MPCVSLYRASRQPCLQTILLKETTVPKPKIMTTLQWDVEDIQKVDAFCTKLGVSRTQFIREACLAAVLKAEAASAPETPVRTRTTKR